MFDGCDDASGVAGLSGAVGVMVDGCCSVDGFGERRRDGVKAAMDCRKFD